MINCGRLAFWMMAVAFICFMLQAEAVKSDSDDPGKEIRTTTTIIILVVFGITFGLPILIVVCIVVALIIFVLAVLCVVGIGALGAQKAYTDHTKKQNETYRKNVASRTSSYQAPLIQEDFQQQRASTGTPNQGRQSTGFQAIDPEGKETAPSAPPTAAPPMAAPQPPLQTPPPPAAPPASQGTVISLGSQQSNGPTVQIGGLFSGMTTHTHINTTHNSAQIHNDNIRRMNDNIRRNNQMHNDNIRRMNDNIRRSNQMHQQNMNRIHQNNMRMHQQNMNRIHQQNMNRIHNMPR